MSIVNDNFSFGYLTVAGTTLTVSHATAFDATLILLMLSTRGALNTPTTNVVASYNGIPLTCLGSITNSGEERAYLYACELPTSGTHNLVINWTNNAICTAGILTYKGAKLPLASSFQSGSGTGDPSLTVASSTGDIVIDVLCKDRSIVTGLTVGAGQTQGYNFDILTSGYEMTGLMSSESGAASVVMSWASTPAVSPWVHLAFNVPAGSPSPRGNPVAISPYFMV